jgi:hypothetical protein
VVVAVFAVGSPVCLLLCWCRRRPLELGTSILRQLVHCNVQYAKPCQQGYKKICNVVGEGTHTRTHTHTRGGMDTETGSKKTEYKKARQTFRRHLINLCRVELLNISENPDVVRLCKVNRNALAAEPSRPSDSTRGRKKG